MIPIPRVDDHVDILVEQVPINDGHIHLEQPCGIPWIPAHVANCRRIHLHLGSRC